METLEAAVARTSTQFLDDVLGTKNTVQQAIHYLVDQAAIYGWEEEYWPELSHFVSVRFPAGFEEIREEARREFFDVLTGKISIGKFSQKYFEYAAVYNRDRKKGLKDAT